jgi:hypothetical protein
MDDQSNAPNATFNRVKLAAKRKLVRKRKRKNKRDTYKDSIHVPNSGLEFLSRKWNEKEKAIKKMRKTKTNKNTWWSICA